MMHTSATTPGRPAGTDRVPLYMYNLDKSALDKIKRGTKISKNERTFYGITRKTSKWKKMLKNLDKDPALPEMITRVLFLDLEMKPPYLLGELLGNRNAPINKFINVLQLAHILLDQIVPRIERHLSKEIDSESQWSESVQGAIRWTPTLLDSACNANHFPLRFLCRVERVSFNTPENVLTVYSILRLRYDVESLLRVYTDSDYHRVLKKIRWRADRIIQHTILQDLIRTVEKYKRMEPSSKFIEKYVGDVRTRVHRGYVKQKAYLDLIKWLDNYKKYGTTNNKTSFVALENDPFKVYEFWLLYEIAYYLKNKRIQVEKKSQPENKLFFQITQNGIKFELCYQNKLSGWKPSASGRKYSDPKDEVKSMVSIPDFIIGMGSKWHIVLDAKYYTDKKQKGLRVSSGLRHIMLGYLMNLLEYDSRVGVLLFPGLKHDEFPPEESVTEYAYTLQGKPERKFKLAIMKPIDIKHKENRNVILEKIFGYICDMDVQLCDSYNTTSLNPSSNNTN